MTKTIRKNLIYSFFILIFSLMSSLTVAQNHVVLVNSNNDISGTDEQMHLEIKRLFLQQKQRWGNGLDATPYAPLEGTETHNAFLDKILEMRQSQLDQFWVKARQTKGITSTSTIRSINVAKRRVTRDEGAFVIITSEEAIDLPEEIRVLFTF